MIKIVNYSEFIRILVALEEDLFDLYMQHLVK